MGNNLTWQQTLKELHKYGDTALNSNKRNELGKLIWITRKLGIGTPITRQKTSYTDNELDTLYKIIICWNILSSISMPEFRDKYTFEATVTTLTRSITSNTPLLIYSIYCPSYNKGVNAYGYTGVCGVHTQTHIRGHVSLVSRLSAVGIEVKGLAIFSDLLLENFNRLVGTNYKQQLEKNFVHFTDLIQSIDPHKLMLVKKLSAYKFLARMIGEKGAISGPIEVPDRVYNIALSRNRVFYRNVLGWDEESVVARTNVLVNSYSLMGHYFRRTFPNGIMYWVESAYERGLLYNGNKQKDPIPIIYPHKRVLTQ